MTVAFVLGNGKSRNQVDLPTLQQHGPIYGCNALYRTFAPNVLVATDRPIATEIQESGYSKNHKFYTRRPLPDLGGLPLLKKYQGFSSGPNALALAANDGYHTLYLLGFDLGTTDGQFNNVYAGTQFYKKITDPPTFAGNWVQQITTICKDFPTRMFVRVTGKESAHIASFNALENLKFMPILDFIDRLNSKKGFL
jgi:hypothetical protein